MKNRISLTSVVIGFVMTVAQTASANSFSQFDTCMDEAAIGFTAKLVGIDLATARSLYESDMSNMRTSQKRSTNMIFNIIQQNIYKQNFPQLLSELYRELDKSTEGYDISRRKRCIADLATSLRR